MKKEYTLKDIQSSILSVAKYLDAFCKENDIKYYLMGGSALGAMRHKGFIPWDDDLDVFMTVENYKKFLKIFPEKGDSQKYFLQHENTKEWPLFLSRICLNGTTVVSDEFKFNMKQHHNVFVDIMCLYSAPDNELLRRLQYYAAQMLRVRALENAHFPQEEKLKWLAMKLSRVVVNPLTRPLLAKFVLAFEGKNTEQVGHFFGRARYPRTNFFRRYIGNGESRYVPFEDTMLPVFENAEDYLVARFGKKWMEMPDQKTRDQYPVHANFVDLEKYYTEYIKDGKWSF
jgi:lipopolysaccharide cholinephosphotransferase